MARVEVRLDDDLLLELRAYSITKGYGRPSNLLRVAVVNYMTRNSLKGPQKARFDKVLTDLRRGTIAVARRASSGNLEETTDATGRPS